MKLTKKEINKLIDDSFVSASTRSIVRDLISEITGETLIERSFKIGQRFRRSGWGDYILACVGMSKYCLIGTTDGNRWVDPVEIAGTTITEREFDRMCGTDAGKFTLIN